MESNAPRHVPVLLGSALATAAALASGAACNSEHVPPGTFMGDDGARDATAAGSNGSPMADGGPLDGGADVDAGPWASNPAPPAGCTLGADGWTTYGHDAQRSFASGGCIRLPLSFAWRHVPTARRFVGSSSLAGNWNAIADGTGVYLHYSSQQASPAYPLVSIERVAPDGSSAWTYSSLNVNGCDYEFSQGDWLTLMPFASGRTYLAVNDDGFFYVDPANGTVAGQIVAPTKVDYWGDTAPGSNRVYELNTWAWDGPGLHLRGIDAQGVMTGWPVQNQVYQHPTCDRKFYASDLTAGLAVDQGTVYYAADYSYSLPAGAPPPPASGYYAFAESDGARKWFAPATPTSKVSAGGGKIYAVEGSAALVARSQSDGHVAWSKPVASDGIQAPVVAGGLVVVATTSSVEAFDATTGAPAWSAPIAGALSRRALQTMPAANQCGTSAIQMRRNYDIATKRPIAQTTLVATTGSGTIAVVVSDGIYVLSLASGKPMGAKVSVPQASGALHDPVVVGKNLYLLDDHGLVALSAP